jgi:hypothetical protein
VKNISVKLILLALKTEFVVEKFKQEEKEEGRGNNNLQKKRIKI